MHGMGSYAIVCFGQLVSIVDPFAAVPIFLALTGGQDRSARTRTALRAALTCLVALGTFAVAGEAIFHFFSITIPAFKIAGGILLFGVGLEMMRAKQSDTRGTSEEQVEAVSKEDVGIIPMGLPLLSGPGAIATSMVLAGKARDAGERVGAYLAVLAVSALAFVMLLSAELVARVLGKTGINVIGRIMGLILAATAIEFIIDGVFGAIEEAAARPELIQAVHTLFR
jgi:multiple antibiotic resistance protein